MTVPSEQAKAQSPSTDEHGVDLAIVSERLRAIVRKMTNTLFRTGRSGVLNMARDFSCCIVTVDDQLLMAADSLPIHVMSGPDLMSAAMKELHPTLSKGDAFLHNSPYHGNSHAADHSLLVPVFDGSGRHRCTVLVKAHQADCGNAVPTTYMGDARDIYSEGALIFPAVRVQRDYEDVEDIVRMCRMRIRIPEQWWGDYQAMVGAARIGEREMEALAADIGWKRMDQLSDRWFDYSEGRMITAIRQLPAGTVTARTAHDPVPGAPEGVEVKVTVKVDPSTARVEVDLRDNSDCLPCGFNLSEACALTAAQLGVFNSLPHAIPANAGSFRRLDVRLRRNCVVGIPVHPTSTSVATTNIADRVAGAVQMAMASLGDGMGMAEGGPAIPASAAVISGRDPRNQGQPFVNQLILAMTGGPGRPLADGWLTLVHTGNAGMCHRDSVEMDELRYPIRVLRQQIERDTEGAGRQCGAPRALVEYGPVDTELQVMYGCDGTVNPAQGVRGGLSGAAGRHQLREVSGAYRELDALADLTLKPGETILARTPGGGGYGVPVERPPIAVQEDVRAGLVTRERAHEVYGVVFDPDLEIDVAATRKLREATQSGSSAPDRSGVGDA